MATTTTATENATHCTCGCAFDCDGNTACGCAIIDGRESCGCTANLCFPECECGGVEKPCCGCGGEVDHRMQQLEPLRACNCVEAF